MTNCKLFYCEYLTCHLFEGCSEVMHSLSVLQCVSERAIAGWSAIVKQNFQSSSVSRIRWRFVLTGLHFRSSIGQKVK